VNKYLPAYTAALALAACSPHTAADTGQPESSRQPETSAVSEADIPVKERNYPQERKQPVDEAKIARNMAAWDKLMATPEQQYPSFEELEEAEKKNPRRSFVAYIAHKKADLAFPKHAAPLKQILPVSDRDIESIAVHYGGMSIQATGDRENTIRFYGVLNFSGFGSYGPDGNLLVRKQRYGDDDMANFRIPRADFAEFVARLNNLRVWRYPNPNPRDAVQHRLMIAVTYRNGKVWALGADKRFGQDRYLEAMIAPDLSPANDDYVFIYVSLRDVVELMQHLDDRVPVFLYRHGSLDHHNTKFGVIYNELEHWKEILKNGK
jgi:lipoprotein